MKKLPRSETHSSKPKIGFTEQDADASFPGGMMTPSAIRTSDEDSAPPAYTVSEATEMVGGSGGSGAGLDLASSSPADLKRRKVPPVPSGKKDL